jgi:uridylate kinase
MVLSVGGSIVAPDGVDAGYVRAFVAALRARLAARPDTRFALVIGGGFAARSYQAALRDIVQEPGTDVLDTVGIAATRMNATLVKAALGDLAPSPVVTDPTAQPDPDARVLVAGGWKPGFSTDNVAVRFAETLGATTVINLSNIRQIYTADPKLDPDARPLDTITWDELRQIVGDEWVPGKNTPFDPVATRRAAELGMTVIAADGRDLENLEAILDGRPFVGTTIQPG